MMARDILIVDDERDICLLMSETLEDEGYSTRLAHDGPSALEAVRARCPSLVILGWVTAVLTASKSWSI